MAISAAGHPKQHGIGEMVVIIPPEHVDTFAKDGWTKDQIREQMQQVSMRSVSELVQSEECAEGIPLERANALGMDTKIPKFRSNDSITLVVAGGEAGKFAAYLGGWASGPMGSSMVTRKIEQ